MSYSRFQRPNYRNAFHFLQQKLRFNVGCGCTLTRSVSVWAEDRGPQSHEDRSRVQLEERDSWENIKQRRRIWQSSVTADMVPPLLPPLMKSLMNYRPRKMLISTEFLVEIEKG